MERKTFLAAAMGAAATLVSGRAVLADATPPPPEPPFHRRGELSSARSLARMRRMLERMIDILQHDQTDYGGHRVQAINDLQQARQQIELALQYDRQHPH